MRITSYLPYTRQNLHWPLNTPLKKNLSIGIPRSSTEQRTSDFSLASTLGSGDRAAPLEQHTDRLSDSVSIYHGEMRQHKGETYSGGKQERFY